MWRGWWESYFTEDPAFLSDLLLSWSTQHFWGWTHREFLVVSQTSYVPLCLCIHAFPSIRMLRPSKVILCKVRSFPRELLKSSFSLHSYPHNSVNAFSSDIVLDAPSPTVRKKALPGQAPCLCHAVPPCASRDRNTFTFCFLLFCSLWSIWAPSSLTRDWTPAPALGVQSLNHWTTREVPHTYLLNWIDLSAAWLRSHLAFMI